MRAVPPTESVVLAAIGQYIGEGFNFPRLDIARGHAVSFHRSFPFVSTTLAYQTALSLGVRLPVA